LIGSGFGTSLSIELWTHLEIFHHARLSESITEFNPNTVQFYNSLYEKGFQTEMINQITDRLVEQQAFMLSTNDLSWLGAWLFICMIPILFLSRNVQASNQGQQGMAH
jgi:DHA2 family multidrug resistance protein